MRVKSEALTTARANKLSIVGADIVYLRVWNIVVQKHCVSLEWRTQVV